jgi:hypothetical protein
MDEAVELEERLRSDTVRVDDGPSPAGSVKAGGGKVRATGTVEDPGWRPAVG